MNIIPFKFIHKDERGSIHCFYIDDREYTVIVTKKGFARGGCIHKERECFTILEGDIFYHCYTKNIDRINQYQKGDGGVIPNNIPHFSHAREDTVMLEWGTDIANMVQDPRTRKIVEDINKRNLEKKKNENNE